MNIKDFRAAIERREYVERISCGEWADGIEECCKKEIEILSEDIPSTIGFLRNECSADEFVWISEIIEDLAAKTQSSELVQCYKSLMSKYSEESKIFYIRDIVESAEAELSGESNDEED